MLKEATATSSNKRTVVPLIVDLVSVVIALLIWSSLYEQFSTNNPLNAVIIGLFFFLFCIAVYWIKKLEPLEFTDSISLEWLTENKLRTLGSLFGIALAAALAHQLGYFDLILEVDDRVLGAGESSAFFVYAPGAWLGAGLIYTLVISSTSAPRYEYDDSEYWVRTGLGMLGVNVMLLVGAAEITAVCEESSLITTFLVTAPLLLLLFLPPRLIYLTKQNSIYSLLSFGVFMLIVLNLVIQSVN